MDHGYHIRLATAHDLSALPDIERRAAIRFHEFGLGDTFATILTPAAALDEGLKAQRLWVAQNNTAELVGFALASRVGEQAHLDELDVLPEYGQRGIGSALVETVCQWARRSGFSAITLTTLSQVPWNAQFYERLGFCILNEDRLTGALKELLQAEIAGGLPSQHRVAMQREL